MKRRLIFDLETDGLDASKIWLIVAIDQKTKEEFVFSDYDSTTPPLNDFKELFDEAEMLCGHNIINFDIPVLKSVCNWTPNEDTKLVDTMLISQLNDFYRPHFTKAAKSVKKRANHSLAVWGAFLGHPKPEDPPWGEYTEEMRFRCEEDARINIEVYSYLLKEVKGIKSISPDYANAIRLEHEVAKEVAQQKQNGWLFDGNGAIKLLFSIESEMLTIEDLIVPKLKNKVMFIDKEPRKATVLKNGKYDRVTRNHFNVESPSDNDGVPDTYQRTKIKETDLGSTEAVIELLLEEGWVPTEYNWKKGENDEWIKRGPKLTDDSFDSITGDLGKKVARWRMLRSRRGFLNGQLQLQRVDGRVPCGGFIVGTNTRRMRHNGIVNVPGHGAPLGDEIRALYVSKEGYKIVAADSDANQLKGLGHYLNNPEIALAMTEGKTSEGTDIHSRNANMIGVDRGTVKGLTYALIFGAGNAKLGETANMPGKGKKLRAQMMEAYAGFIPMLASMEAQWSNHFFHTGRGYGISLDGSPIFCDKWRLLNALLQAFESVTCKSAVVKAMSMIREEGLDAKLVCWYHDEINLEVKDEHAVRAKEILEYALGPYVTEHLNLNIAMSAEGSIGNNWYEVH